MNTPTSALPKQPWWNRDWLLAALLLAAVVFAYQPAWRAGFIWDDNDYVTENPLLTAPDGLRRIWFSTDSPSQYFPLVYTTFRAEHALWGLNAAGYHWVNILLHGVNALLVWRLLRRLKIPGSWFAAALFALHPVQVESVAWITELKNVQSLFFFLLAVHAWVSFVRLDIANNVVEIDASNRPAGTRTLQGGWIIYAAALVFHLLALCSKTTACTLPAALVLTLWLKHIPITRWRIAQLAPFAGLSVAMGLVSVWWESHHQGTVGSDYAFNFLERCLIAGRAIWFYLGKLLWPANLTFNYPLWKIDAADWTAWLGLVAALIAAAVIWRGRRFTGRSVETAAVFFAAMLSPLLGFFMLYTFKYTFVADHYQYVGMLGPVALIAAGLAVALRGPAQRWAKFAPACALAVLIGLSALTWRQTRMYHDLETLWRETIARNPESYMAHNNLGAILLGRGEFDEAIAHFNRALEILPTHGNAHGNLAHALLRKGRIDEALAHFHQAVEAEPNLAKAHSDLAYGLLSAGRVGEALVDAGKALTLPPVAPAETNHVMGLTLLAAGQPEAAAQRFQAALQFRPDYAEARVGLGEALLRTGSADGAANELSRALAEQPNNVHALLLLATALAQSGKFDAALGRFDAVIAAQPNNPEAQNGAGWALLQLGRVDEAIARFERALQLQPDLVIAHCNLALACNQKGDTHGAVAHFQAFLRQQPDTAPVLSRLAWLLATSPDGAVRDGGRAVELAERANALSGGQDAAVLRTLAAAYAENGRFSNAIATARQALEFSPAGTADALRAELALYEAATPSRDRSLQQTAAAR